MRIRLITDSDLPAVFDVYRQCEDFLALGPAPHASLEMVQADRALTRDQGGRYCGIFDDGGALLGVLDYIPSDWNNDPACAFLELLMIAAPHRGQGLGTRVVAWLEEDLRRIGTARLESGVQVNNPQAVRFWQRMGFRITSGAEPQPDGTVAYHLEKDLGPAARRSNT